MTRSCGRRFDEIALGEVLPAMDVVLPVADTPIASLIERFVAAWAGGGATLDRVRVTRHLPARSDAGLRLAGRVYGRHMDGSRRIEVEVTGRDGLEDRVRGMVCVRLA